MKINPLSAAARFLNEVRSKEDRNEHSGHQQSGYHPDRRKNQEQEIEVTDEKVTQAVEAFNHADSQAQANGLSVSTTGHGPGLRVVLKDLEGHVVRNLTGEEFLRLREATTQGDSTRGKILDQKL